VSGPFGDGLFIPDASAFARAAHPRVRDSWREALLAGRFLVCEPVAIELLVGARGIEEFDARRESLSALRRIELTAGVARAAVTALRELAAFGHGYQRVKPIDALIAACAQEAGVGVLHYDHHYDRLAQVMAFESRWIAPAGSLD
jgi:predicted nucleic acid-binding protein